MTAEEFLIQYYDEGGDGPSFIESVREQMSEMAGFDFDTLIDGIEAYAIHKAKYHVGQALKAASENATQQTIIGGYGDPNKSNKIVINKSSILNAYPLENIK